MTWRPLLGFGALALVLVTAYGCGGDGGVEAVASDGAAHESAPASEATMQRSVSADVVGSDRGIAQASPSSAVSQDGASLPPAALPAAASGPTFPQESHELAAMELAGEHRSASPSEQSAAVPWIPAAPCSSDVATCQPRDVGSFDLFSRPGGASSSIVEASSVEDVLEQGLRLAGASPVHIVVRGTASSDSVRCGWRGIARTVEQRANAIRYWLGLEPDAAVPDPSYVEVLFTTTLEVVAPVYLETAKSNFLAIARGGLSEEYLYLTCFADYDVSEYLLGGGPTSTLTVAYDRMDEAHSHELYGREHAAGVFVGQPLMSEQEYGDRLDGLVWAAGSRLSTVVGGRESILFLAPMGAHNAIAVEAWQVVAQWDLQTDDGGTVNAVRYGVSEYDPEYTQPLADLQSRITAATAATSTSTTTPSRISNVSGLRQYYVDIGAYGDITPGDNATTTFTPAQPPAVYAPAVSSLTASSTGEETASLSWASVSGASGYHVQHRLSETGGRWTTATSTLTGTTYTVGGLQCNSPHDFRVGAYGDGTTYNTRAGLWSPTATSTTDTCSPRAPEFESASYAFDVSVVAPAGVSVGTVSATDVNDDPITYSITAGNASGKFAIVTSTGEITVAASLGSAVGATFTLTVGASDGVSGTTSVTVTVTVVAIDCSVGRAVANPSSEPGLVSDCETLLGLQNALDGTATLNWSIDTPITSWDGVTVSSTPLRVTELDLDRRDLRGVIPPGLGKLSGLERLVLSLNILRGEIPRELGALSDLRELDIYGNWVRGSIPRELGGLSELTELKLSLNLLTGEIPRELGALSKLEELWLGDNRLTGELPRELGDLTRLRLLSASGNRLTGPIPWELGSLPDLVTLYLRINRFEGCIRPALRRIRSNDLGDLGLPDCTEDGRAPAPQGLRVSLAGSAFSLSWTAVSGADRYDVQHRKHRLGGPGDWRGVATTTSASATYSLAGGTACGTTYEFRVRSEGDGVTYAVAWGVASGVESVTTTTCIPEFATSTYAFAIAENATTTDPVGTVSATDADDETLAYSIASGNAAGKFAIATSTGAITVAGGLDHETAPAYTLTVTASDGRGGAATTTVEVSVTDVPEDTPPAPGGLDVSLTDDTFGVAWSAVSGAAFYEVQQQVAASAAGWALVATTTGLSATYSPAGGTECGTTYEFRVRAYGDGTTYVADWGGPSQPEPYTTEACNRAPEFATPTYAFTVAENAGTTDAVGTVSATDPDSDPVSYAITGGNAAGKFAIGMGTGAITVAGGLDHETAPSYTLTVEARDDRDGVATTTVEIMVTDVAEDTPPAPGGVNVSLTGDTFGVTWSAVSGAAFYEVQQQVSGSGDGWALVATTTGLSATYSPAGGTECGTTYEFRVRAYGDGTTYVADWGAPSQPEPYTTAACNRAPEFATPTYAFAVAENATTTDAVGTVSATDPDSDPVSYAIASGNSAGKFAIATTTGAITVAGGLDHETVSSYTLTLEARDDRDGVATATVEIVVTDVAEDTPPAPGGLGVSLSDDTFGVTWSAVTGAAFYEVQQQVSASGDGWALVATTTGLSATYSPAGGAECGTTYEFRVRSYGDGTTYVTDWGEPSEPEPYTTEVCNRVPRFGASSHTLTISENAATSSSVGTISATDPDGDTVTYSITAGNDDGKFAIATSTGTISLTGTVDPDVLAFYALTVAASDGVAGTSTAAVGVAVLLDECSNGTVVPRPRSNPRLVRDCSMLLAARDALAGDASLDWSADTRINDWQGLRVESGDSPYVRVLLLTGMGLTGRIPPELGGVADLRRIDLDDNMLTGGIPRELGSLADMVLMYLHMNRLTGSIPAELGALSNLQTLNLSDNMLTGGIPAELGKLSNLRELLIEDNSLTGGIPAELAALSNLWSLYLSENMLTGGIPIELGRLSNLRYLVLERNSLGGEIPSQLGGLTRLEAVYLRNNGLTGTIPAEWGDLPNLTYLYLSGGNDFTGCIPSGLRDVADNDLEGLGLDYCSPP